MPFLSLTTWSLHRNLGPMRWTKWDEQNGTHVTQFDNQPEITSLLELPAVLAEKGFSAVEICHFHVPDTSDEYLIKLRDCIQNAGIRFYTMLLDYGDISSANGTRRNADIAWMKQWIDYASLAGAERVRIIGGDGDPSDREAFARSAEALKELSEYASARGVRVVTENFHALTSTSSNCLGLMDACGDRLGLTSDFGNFKGPHKYEELSKTVPYSESIHAKAQTNEAGIPDKSEFEQCMQIVRASGYEGPVTLVYDGPHDMWAGIERVKALVVPYLQ